MAIANNGLAWHPLYWMHHDQWQYYHETGYDSIITYDHYGHMHFFMLGFVLEQIREHFKDLARCIDEGST